MERFSVFVIDLHRCRETHFGLHRRLLLEAQRLSHFDQPTSHLLVLLGEAGRLLLLLAHLRLELVTLPRELSLEFLLAFRKRDVERVVHPLELPEPLLQPFDLAGVCLRQVLRLGLQRVHLVKQVVLRRPLQRTLLLPLRHGAPRLR